MNEIIGVSLNLVSGVWIGGAGFIRIWPTTARVSEVGGTRFVEADLYDGVDARRQRTDGDAGAKEPPKVRFLIDEVTAVTW